MNTQKFKNTVPWLLLLVTVVTSVTLLFCREFPFGSDQRKREDAFYTILVGELAIMKRMNNGDIPEAKDKLRDNIQFIKDYSELFIHDKKKLDDLNFLIKNHLDALSTSREK